MIGNEIKIGDVVELVQGIRHRAQFIIPITMHDMPDIPDRARFEVTGLLDEGRIRAKPLEPSLKDMTAYLSLDDVRKVRSTLSE